MPHLRTTLYKLGAIALGVAIAGALGESVVRLLHLYSDARFIAPHPRYGVYNIPGAHGWYVKGEVRQYVTINDRGLRDRDAWSDGEGVLLLGDSFIAAFQVPPEATCQEIAERLLSQALGRSTEVVAAACNGWGTANQLAFLQEEGFSYKPAAIVLALFPENDLLDNLNAYSTDCPWPPQPHDRVSVLLPGFVRQGLGTNPTIRGAIDRVPMVARLLVRPAVARAERAMVRGFLHLWSRASTPLQARMWSRMTELLGAMRVSATTHGASFAVLIVPGRLALYPQETERFIRHHAQLREADLDPAAPRRRLAALLDSLEIPSVDLLPAFKRASDLGDDMLFRREGHWTTEGNGKAAEGLCRLVLERRLLRSCSRASGSSPPDPPA